MASTEKMMQLFKVINTKKSTKVKKAISKDDHEFIELKDEHENKIEVRFYPDYYKESDQ